MSNRISIIGIAVFAVGIMTAGYSQFIYDPTVSPMDNYQTRADSNSSIQERLAEIRRLQDAYGRASAGERIVNMSRLEEQGRIFLFGLFLSGLGAVMFFTGRSRPGANANNLNNNFQQSKTFRQEKSTTNDAYRIWLVNRYSIKKHEVFGSYICNNELFDSLDGAIIRAHELESLSVDDRSRETANVDAYLNAQTGNLKTLIRHQEFRNFVIFVVLAVVGLIVIVNLMD